MKNFITNADGTRVDNQYMITAKNNKVTSFNIHVDGEWVDILQRFPRTGESFHITRDFDIVADVKSLSSNCEVTVTYTCENDCWYKEIN